MYPALRSMAITLSGRRGGGSSAAENSGPPERAFQKHGRWKSVKLSLSKSLGL